MGWVDAKKLYVRKKYGKSTCARILMRIMIAAWKTTLDQTNVKTKLHPPQKRV
ncbi:hypothetical protein GWL_22550 [Herbaspirillum sp. GW103]|jgi:hypothetical protein|nr:hypothetical protein GWL_22550 [Herbaspirillum sp. GW103]